MLGNSQVSLEEKRARRLLLELAAMLDNQQMRLEEASSAIPGSYFSNKQVRLEEWRPCDLYSR
jgi:hypothetical protein